MPYDINKIISTVTLILSIFFFSGCSSGQIGKRLQPTQQAEIISNSDLPKKHQICPAGFVLIAGNSNYGTGDFCVMKYDAKCAQASDLSQGIQPGSESNCSGKKNGELEGVYKNNASGCACRDDKQIVSTPTGFPITFIPSVSGNQDNAKSYCKAQGWHLMTNSEWMTIARNVEQVSENWCDRDGSNCGFAPGTKGKILANGHNDNNNEIDAGASSHSALIAGDDSQPCFGTTVDASNVCGGKSSQKRTLRLSSGNVIWDFAGNVWHWVDATIARKDQPKSQTNGILDHGFVWSDFAPGSLPTVISDNGRASLGYDAFRPSNPAWNSTDGVGRIYHFSGSEDNNSTQYGFIRGGNWRHGYDSGAFCIHLSPLPNTANIDDVGFRCVASL